ncbi:MAG: hypothetical protein M1814_003590 [Vezdaea aestivalis]|nr:MAG: hypothetical protein M1814_003590 [Vezdaea aestivalis]
MEKDTSRPPYRLKPSTPIPSRPLVSYVKNEWRHNPTYGQTTVPSITVSPPSSQRRTSSLGLFLRSPKLRRYVLVYAALLLLAYLLYTSYFSPSALERSLLTATLDDSERMKKGWFGVNARPDFSDFDMVGHLDKKHIPLTGPAYTHATHAAKKRRLIFIGDIHGCVDERMLPFPSISPFRVQLSFTKTVNLLLHTLSHDPSTDHLVAAGDMISRGPSSPSVLTLLASHSASCVRGNHEDRLLLAHSSQETYQVPLPGPFEDPQTNIDDLSEHSHSHGDYPARALALSLDSKQTAFLKSCPVILELGPLKGLSEKSVSVVHAGLVPGVEASKQDPFLAMNMRSLDPETLLPSEKRSGSASVAPGSKPWYKVWEAWQARLPKRERSWVVYGHDSREGVRIGKTSVALDGGCVRGGRLTALVVEGGKGGVGKRVVSVPCKDYRQKH